VVVRTELMPRQRRYAHQIVRVQRKDALAHQATTLPVNLNLTVQFPTDIYTYYKVITCNAPLVLGITCAPNPPIIGPSDTPSVSITTAGVVGYLRPGKIEGRGSALAMAFSSVWAAGVVWFTVPRRRRHKKVWIARLLLLVLACSSVVMVSCGGSFAPAIPPGGVSSSTPPGTYFITGSATLFQKAADGKGVQIGTPQNFLIQLLVK